MAVRIPYTDFTVEKTPRPAVMAALTPEGKQAANEFSGSDPKSRVLYKLKDGPATAISIAEEPMVNLDLVRVKAVLSSLESEGLIYRIQR